MTDLMGPSAESRPVQSPASAESTAPSGPVMVRNLDSGTVSNADDVNRSVSAPSDGGSATQDQETPVVVVRNLDTGRLTNASALAQDVEPQTTARARKPPKTPPLSGRRSRLAVHPPRQRNRSAPPRSPRSAAPPAPSFRRLGFLAGSGGETLDRKGSRPIPALAVVAACEWLSPRDVLCSVARVSRSFARLAMLDRHQVWLPKIHSRFPGFAHALSRHPSVADALVAVRRRRQRRGRRRRTGSGSHGSVASRAAAVYRLGDNDTYTGRRVAGLEAVQVKGGQVRWVAASGGKDAPPASTTLLAAYRRLEASARRLQEKGFAASVAIVGAPQAGKSCLAQRLRGETHVYGCHVPTAGGVEVSAARISVSVRGKPVPMRLCIYDASSATSLRGVTAAVCAAADAAMIVCDPTNASSSSGLGHWASAIRLANQAENAARGKAAKAARGCGRRNMATVPGTCRPVDWSNTHLLVVANKADLLVSGGQASGGQASDGQASGGHAEGCSTEPRLSPTGSSPSFAETVHQLAEQIRAVGLSYLSAMTGENVAQSLDKLLVPVCEDIILHDVWRCERAETRVDGAAPTGRCRDPLLAVTDYGLMLEALDEYSTVVRRHGAAA